MKKVVMLFAVFSIFTLQGAEIVETVVANLNGRAITYTEIIQEGELINIENNIPPDASLTPELKKKILDLVIFRIIAFQEAREQDITVDDDTVNKKVKTYRSNVYMNDFLKKYEITDLEFNTMIKMRLLGDKLVEEFVERRFKDKDPKHSEITKAVSEWQQNLFKKQRLVFYSIP
jgi:hypothetical protein